MDMDTTSSSVVHLSCHCLNINIRVVSVQASQCPTLHLRDLAGEKFLQTSVDLGNDWYKSTIRALVQCDQTSDGDTFTKCILCNTTVYVMCATPDGSGKFLVNSELLDSAAMEKVRRSPLFSSALDVLMPEDEENDTKMPLKVDTKEDFSGSVHGSPGVVEIFGESFSRSSAAQEIQASCNRYLQMQQQKMDERIRAFVDREHDEFERIRLKAKLERNRLLKELQNRQQENEVDRKYSGDEMRFGRQRSGEDSAVPLSPISLASAGHSPATTNGGSTIKWPGPPSPGSGTSPMGGTRPIRLASAGGVPSLPSHPEEGADLADDELFSLDEDTMTATGAFLPADDEQEEETDDSGTGEDIGGMNVRRHYNRYNPTPGAGMLVSKFGTSLPVTIPGRFWPPKDAKDSAPGSSSEENSPKIQQVLPSRRSTDVREGMKALARSIQAADDPERLFGERPQRRRYKTGDVVRMRTATAGLDDLVDM